MRKYRVVLFYLGTILCMYLLMRVQLPKYKSILHMLVLVFVVDYYFFICWKKQVEALASKLKRKLLYGIHFTPFLLIWCFLIGISFSSVGNWPPFLRTYLLGIIVILLLPRMVMALIYALIAFFRKIIPSSSFRKKLEDTRPLVVGGVGALVFLLIMYGSIVTVFDLRWDRIKEASSRVPEGFKKYRIVQISDLHIGSFINDYFLERVAKQIQVLKPDMVVFTGDMVNFSSKEMYPFLGTLSRMVAPDGVYAVMGNHDYGDYVSWPSAQERQRNLDQLRENYRSLGWVLLDNTSLWIRRGEDSLRLVGVENWGKGARFPKRGDLKRALSYTACTMDSMPYERFRRSDFAHIYTLLLSHDPSHFDSVVYKQYPQIDLCLSGHTHGMQMGLRIKGRDYSLGWFLYKHHAGMYTMENGQKIYINTGLGFNGLPFRIGIPPRITLFEL